MLYVLAVLVLLASLYMLAKTATHRASAKAAASLPSQATASEIDAFFRQPERYQGQPLEQVVTALGMWSVNDDWDWGRLVYEWKRPGLRLRVITDGNLVRVVERLDPEDTSRFGTVIETLLDQPFNCHGHSGER